MSPFNFVPLEERTFRRKIHWGDLYWFDFGKPESKQKTFAYVHPALIVSDTESTLPGTLLITPVTDAAHKRKGYEFHVEISKREYPQLDKDSIVKVDQIYCVTRRPHFPDQYYIATLSLDTMRRIYVKLLRVLNVQRVITK